MRWDDRSRSAEVHPLQSHGSGYYFYAVDLSAFDFAAKFEIEVADTAVKDRTAETRLTISEDPYGPVEEEALSFVKKEFTGRRALGDPLGEAARNILIMAYGRAAGVKYGARLEELAGVLKERASGAKVASEPESCAFSAWALGCAARECGKKDLLDSAQKLLQSVWETGKWKELMTAAALAGAGSVIAPQTREVLDRDIADDMVRFVAGKQDITGRFPLRGRELAEHWPLLAAAQYLLSFPDSNLGPTVRTILDRNAVFQERLLTETPYGQAKVALDEKTILEIPRWPRGDNVYLLSTACSLLFTTKAAPNDPFRFHAERLVQFIYGYNPLGKRLRWEKGESLRSDGGEKYRPGTVLLSHKADPLRTALYLAWAARELRTQLRKAEARFRELKPKRR